jgi:hypothetical protein
MAIFALTAVWSLMSPLFSGPDEPSNFVRSAAVVRGEWVGDNVMPSLLKSYWTTTVNIDPQFGAANNIPWCFAPFSDRPGCGSRLEETQVTDNPAWTNMGRYPIAPFLVSGVGTVLGATDMSVRMARLMTSLLCAVFITFAVGSLLRRGVSRVGLLVALLPGTVFLASTMNPSAIEICAAISLWAVFPALDGGSLSRWDLIAFASSGALLILTRPIGPVLYVIVLAFSYGLQRDPLRITTILAKYRNIFIAHAFSVLFALWWYFRIYDFQTASKVFDDTPSISTLDQIDSAIHHIPILLDQAVGNFGWLDAPMPRIALYIAYLLVATLIGMGVKHMHNRSRAVLLMLIIVILLIAIMIDLNIYALLGVFGAQGRHIVPLLVGLPMIAATSIVWKRNWEVVTVGIWGLVMVWAGLGALRRYTVGINGDNAMDMFTDRAWNPVFGFWPTVMMLILSTLAVVCLFPYSRPSAK